MKEEPMLDPLRPAQERYATLVAAFATTTDVTQGANGTRAFGAEALHVGGKIFALLTRDRLVVKLPRQRVDALVATGEGERFDPRRDGRLMKEWLVVAPTSNQDWLALAHEALTFVAAPHEATDRGPAHPVSPQPPVAFPRGSGAPATRALAAAGYTELRQLADVAAADLRPLHGMGPKALRLLQDALVQEGLSLA